MQNTATTSRFLIDFSLERELVDSGILVSRNKQLQLALTTLMAHRASSRHIFDWLAESLIKVAEHSFGVRDNDSLEEVSLVLKALPVTKTRIIGQYYRALAIRRSGRIDEALPLLEAVADSGLVAYRARALQSLGAINHSQLKIGDALKFYAEAKRVVSTNVLPDLLTTLLVDQEIACIRSEMGDHRGAEADYEKIYPLVRIVSREHPLYFYFYHNELAVELLEVGRVAEARLASTIALASPFAHAYPEWTATRDEIAAKCKSASRSVVAIQRAPQAEHTQHPRLQLATTPQVTILGCSTYLSDFVQRAFFHFPATTITVLNAVSILLRMLGCTGPRAPPPF